MRARLLALSLAALLVLPSCSALGLDQIPVADCSHQGPDWAAHDLFCATLVTTHPTSDTCRTWQCGHTSHHCEIVPRDADHDGYAAMECAAAGTMPDCDDADPSNYPTNTEVCDGHDNDCDMIVDEMAIEASFAPGMAVSLPFVPEQTVVGVGGGGDTTVVVAHMNQDYQTVSIGATSSVSSLAFSQAGMAITLAQGSHAMSGLGGAAASYALVVPSTDACSRFGLFPYAGGGAATLRGADSYAFPACPMTGTAQFSGPAVAGLSSGELLVAWYAASDAPRECGAASAAPVAVGTAYFDPHSMGDNRFGDVVTLGSSVADGSPAVLAADATHFLAAYPRADGSIAVHLVTTDASFQVVSQAVAYTEPAATGVRQGVSLALDPSTLASGSVAIALAWNDGCGATPLSLRRLTLSGATLSAGRVTTTMGTPGSSATRRRLRLVSQPRSAEWLLTWTTGNGVSAQRFTREGALQGPAFELLHTMTSEHAVEPLASRSAPLYRLVTVQGTSVTQGTFGCAAM